ncbi:uncharacterized protein [Diadema antillarum]|uniref:uncharacterized protein n=1 Tax=Diadema antillarum TaxID=105358 RepID=UPI003A86E53E
MTVAMEPVDSVAENDAEHRRAKSHHAVTVDDVIAQENERSWMDTLLSCSGEANEETDYISMIVCNDWKEAAHGWQDTQPFVKYAWGEDPSPSKKRESDDALSKRIKVQRRQKASEEDSWRRCVEPRTYRYVYDPKGLHHSTLKFYSGIALERSREEGFTDHILKLREYLEKTLNQAKKQTSNGIKEHAKLGQFFANQNSRTAKKNLPSKRVLGKLHGLGDGLYVRTEVSSPEDEEDRRLTVGMIKGKKYEGGAAKLTGERQATPILPVRKVDKLNVGQLNKRTSSRESHTLKLSHGANTSHSPVNSYEKFPAQSVAPPSVQDSSLSPLKKITPHQRQIHDDNEALSHDQETFILSHYVDKPLSAKSEPDHTPSYKVLLERSSAPHMGGRADGSMFAESSMGYGRHMATKEFPLAQELASVSKLLREQEQKNKSKGKRARPVKLGGGYMNSSGDPGVPKLGEPLHRGVIDRETAGAMASELLPGVSGHKLGLPVYSQRIL